MRLAQFYDLLTSDCNGARICLEHNPTLSISDTKDRRCHPLQSKRMECSPRGHPSRSLGHLSL